jgi:PAS domain S-box-containing protein
MPQPEGRPPLTIQQAARYLGIPVEATEALVQAGFLRPSGQNDDGPLLPLVDLKAFLARNADGGTGNIEVVEPEEADPAKLLEALNERADEMAYEAMEIFSSLFPHTRGWSVEDQARFLAQCKGRFEAILAVTGQDSDLDEALVGDLQEVGASAVREGAPFPELLLMLRISRDLVVQTAVELAEEGGRHWGTSLSLLLHRVIPAMDQLTDALAEGYWTAVIGRQKEARARYEHVVEQASDGIYEIDLHGRIQYANPSLGLILGRRRLDELQGSYLADVLSGQEARPPPDQMHSAEGGRRVELEIMRPDGVHRVVDIRTMPRVVNDELIGFQGVVRDVTATHRLDLERRELLGRLTNDLRTPLAALSDLSRDLSHGEGELGRDRALKMGRAIREEVDRITRLVDDVYDVSTLQPDASAVTPRPVELASVIDQALEETPPQAQVQVKAPEGIRVMADDRALAQVIANLLRNAVEHGRPPVELSVEGVESGLLHLVVTDHGEGVDPELVPTLFSRVHMMSRRGRDRSRGVGAGLSLARALAEAMGGRVWYAVADHGGARFHLTVPVPNRRREDKPIRL